MWNLILSLLAFLAVAAHADEPIAQDPNDPVYEKKPLSAWLKQLHDKDPDSRKRAAYAMRDLGPKAKEAVPTLLKMLKEDSSVEPRQWAAYALATVAPKDPVVPRALIEAMQNDAAEKVRSSASYALSNMEPKPTLVIPELKQLLRNKSADVRKNAVEALAAIQEPKALTSFLISSLGDKDAGVRDTIAFYLAVSGENSLPALRGALANENPAVRAGAALALGNLGRFARHDHASLVKELIPSILSLLNDKESAVRESAAEALYLIAHREPKIGVPALVTALKDQSPIVRRWSVLALGEIGPESKAAVSALTEALTDQSERVRKGAAAALGRIGPKAKAAVPALIIALEDRDVSVRGAAASGLAGIGPDAKEALPALRKASMSQDRYLQPQAVNAMRNIDVVVDLQKDAKNFDAIVRYWQQQCPGTEYDGQFIHRTNGPGGYWLHINVPQPIESLYQHPFSRQFLDQHRKDKGNFRQAIAADLLLLKQPILSTSQGGTISVDEKRRIPCIDYRVLRTWEMVCWER